MTESESTDRIVRAIYILCAITVIGLVASVVLVVALTNKSIAAMHAVSQFSEEQQLTTEFFSLLERKQLDELKARCRQEIESKPLSRTGYFYMGIAHYHAGESNQCKEYLERALQIDPTARDSIQPYLDAL